MCDGLFQQTLGNVLQSFVRRLQVFLIEMNVDVIVLAIVAV